MSAALQSLTVAEFLAWERTQPVRYEFDGVQPVAMTGGTAGSDRVARRLIRALEDRLASGCEVFAESLKVITNARVRYPDVQVVCGQEVPDVADHTDPIAVFEIVSPSTELTDRRVKPREYASVPSIQVYVILAQDRPAATILRRAAGWTVEDIGGSDAILALPEIGVSVPLSLLYPTRP